MPSQREPFQPDAPRVENGPVTRVPMKGAGRRRRWFVHIACTVAVLLFAVTVAMLYFGWLEESEPVGVIVVQGQADVATATCTVSGPGLTAPLSRTFSEGTDLRLRFHVAPGTYRIQVFRGTDVLYSNDHVTVEKQPVDIDPFNTRLPATAPVTTAPTRPI